MDPEVLVVEDEVLVLMLLRDAFEDAGLRVTAATDAESALSMLDERAGGGAEARPRPNVLVTDLNLGPGADGLALAAAVRRRMPDLPVVYVTGNPDLVTARGLGPGERLVPKPFDPLALAQQVRALADAAGEARRRSPSGPAAGPS